MTLTLLATLSYTAGMLALLYLLLARFNALNHARALQESYGSGEHDPPPPSPERDAVAEAHWRRAEILLQNGRLDAAVADCRKALTINPDHGEAKALLTHLFPGEAVSGIRDGSLELGV